DARRRPAPRALPAARRAARRMERRRPGQRAGPRLSPHGRRGDRRADRARCDRRRRPGRRARRQALRRRRHRPRGQSRHRPAADRRRADLRARTRARLGCRVPARNAATGPPFRAQPADARREPGDRDRPDRKRRRAFRSRRAAGCSRSAGDRQCAVLGDRPQAASPAASFRRPVMRPPDHPAVASGRVGVLLVNLGTPDAPTPGAVRRYLAEFLSDRRVVEIPPVVWQPILRGIILNTRPKKSARAYAQVWTEAGSPLAAITAEQARVLQARLGDTVEVAHAMRYGRPAIGDELQKLVEAGCDRILLAPLYPQYSASTTATAIDAAGKALRRMRRQPALRTLPPY